MMTGGYPRKPTKRFPAKHPVMRSSPDVKVNIPGTAGRSCTGASDRAPESSSQNAASTLGLGLGSEGSGFGGCFN